jgi:hypothetical protein
MQEEPLKSFLNNYVFGQKDNSQGKSTPKKRPWLRYWPILAVISLVIVTCGVYLVIKYKQPQTISQNYPADLSADNKTKTAPISENIEKTGYDSSLRSSATFAQTKGLTITGIICSKDNPSAIVGNQLVHEGDNVSGVTIVKINQESVEFEKNNIRWTQAVKEPPSSHWE